VIGTIVLNDRRGDEADRLAELAFRHLTALADNGDPEAMLDVIDRVRGSELSLLIRSHQLVDSLTGNDQLEAVTLRDHLIGVLGATTISEASTDKLIDVAGYAKLAALVDSVGNTEPLGEIIGTPKRPVVAVVIGDCGGFVIIDQGPDTSQQRHVEVHRLAAGNLTERVNDFVGSIRSCSNDTRDHYAKLQQQQQPYPTLAAEPLTRLRDAVSRTCEWLGENVMKQILAHIPDAEEIYMMACGQLSLLPLHAAILPADPTHTHSRHVFEHVNVKYLPTRFLPQPPPGQDPERHPPRSISHVQLLIAGLHPASTTTITNAINDYAENKHLTVTEYQNFDDEVWNADYIHITGHTQSDPQNPGHTRYLKETLIQHQNQVILELRPVIDLPSILATRLSTKLVFSSTCQSARPNTNQPDNQISLAAAFLTAGAQTVIATLWDVIDTTTADLTDWFYKELTNADTPAEALTDTLIDMNQPHTNHGIETWAAYAQYGR